MSCSFSDLFLKQNKSSLTGIVYKISDNNTIKVLVMEKKKHSVVKKYVTIKKIYTCHVENASELKISQTINVFQIRPISKTKKFLAVVLNNKNI